MKDLIAKITASKTSKIIACLIIALPIWAIMTFVDFTPDVETSVTVTETQSQTTNSNETENNAKSTYFCVAKVVELNEETMLVEIVDKGDTALENGNQVHISTEKIKEILSNDLSIENDVYIRIEFDGNIMETSPLQLGEISKIEITNREDKIS